MNFEFISESGWKSLEDTLCCMDMVLLYFLALAQILLNTQVAYSQPEMNSWRDTDGV